MICSICGCEMKNNGGWFACPTCGSVHFGPDPNEDNSSKQEEKKEASPANPAEEPIEKKNFGNKPAVTAKTNDTITPAPEENPKKSNSDFLFFVEDFEEKPVKEKPFTASKAFSDNENAAPVYKANDTAEKEEQKPEKQAADEPKEAPEPVNEFADEPKKTPSQAEEPVIQTEESTEELFEVKKDKIKKEKEKKKRKEKPEPQEQESSDNEKKRSKLKDVIDFLLPIVAAVMIAFVLKTFIIANAKVPTGSMINTINIGDRIIASRLAYMTETPSRYDIILFYYPDDESDIFVKRVIGLPGETLEVIDGIAYITTKDGKTIQTDQSFVNPAEIPEGNYGPYYIPEKGEVITVDGDYCYAENGMIMGDKNFLDKYCVKEGFKYVIAENLYFMLGDNRNQSADSRRWEFPFVAENKIIGKVLFRYYPFDSIGKIE